MKRRISEALTPSGFRHAQPRQPPRRALGLLDRKRLELTRALATDPSVLLLDEIGGGLTDGEATADRNDPRTAPARDRHRLDRAHRARAGAGCHPPGLPGRRPGDRRRWRRGSAARMPPSWTPISGAADEPPANFRPRCAPRLAPGGTRRRPRPWPKARRWRWSAPTAPARRHCSEPSPAPIRRHRQHRVRRRGRHGMGAHRRRCRNCAGAGRTKALPDDDRRGEPSGRRRSAGRDAGGSSIGARDIPALKPVEVAPWTCPAESSRHRRSAVR